jgi:hypothetical protein
MNNYTYNDIIYVGSSKPLICRDGNIQYANSMDLRFITYDDLKDLKWTGHYIIIDIAVGWTTSYDMDIIESFIDRVEPSRVSIRLVDQFEHQGTQEVYLRMIKLVIDKGTDIIGTYDADYYGLKVGLVLPYPYLVSDEITKNYHMYKITTRMILTGADVKGIYPTREKLYAIADKSDCIDTVKHPGYSGKYWDTGVIGQDFIKRLNRYAFMACTTCNEGYELLKYVECAEAGCIPIGDVPNSFMDNEQLRRCIIKVPDEALSTSEKFDEWMYETRMRVGIVPRINEYRELISKLRNKELLQQKLLDYINSRK